LPNGRPATFKGNAEGGAANGAVLRKQTQDGKDDEGKALTDADKHYLMDNSIDFAVPEYKQYRTILPNVSFVPDAKVVMARPGRNTTRPTSTWSLPPSKAVTCKQVDLSVFRKKF
jgi:hypothetical protein